MKVHTTVAVWVQQRQRKKTFLTAADLILELAEKDVRLQHLSDQGLRPRQSTAFVGDTLHMWCSGIYSTVSAMKCSHP